MSRPIRTQVAIIGAGPAGLTLACLLHAAGIESVVLENRSREYVEQRIRAGVLEQGTVDLLDAAGVGERMRREGIVHHGIYLQFAGERHRIPLSELADGRSIVIYGQTEVVKDLIAARLDAGLALRFEVEDVGVHEIETDRPRVSFAHAGERFELECDVIAGLRRLPRRVPAGDREAAAGLLARLPVRLARDPRRGAAVERRAGLRAPRAGLRAAQPALAGAQPPLSPVRRRRASRSLAGRPDLG